MLKLIDRVENRFWDQRQRFRIESQLDDFPFLIQLIDSQKDANGLISGRKLFGWA
jgi:hypothetical protein